MARSIATLPRMLLSSALALSLVWAAAPAADAKSKRVLTLMTRNLYLGADLNPILFAPDLPSLLAAVGAAWDTVQASNPAERMEAIADEIAASRPDIVGLQEVSLWRTDTPADGPATPATTVVFDFLDLLLSALSERGQHYAPVTISENFDAELPTGLTFEMDVRLTDRDVIIARTDRPASAFKLSNARSALFAAAIPIQTDLGDLLGVRGWNAVDVKVRGKTIRLVNTHLETSAAPPIQLAQAAELLGGPASTSLPVVMLGDFNTRADGLGTPTYGVLLASGFTDAWSVAMPGDPGDTCCQAEDLRNAVSLLDERIDLVLSRGSFANLGAAIVGEHPDDRTPSGLWPSDHAGVVATLRLD